MNSKCIINLAIGILLLNGLIQVVQACVLGGAPGAKCGDEQAPTCANLCELITCPREVKCNGFANAYYCVENPITVECNRYFGNCIRWTDGYGNPRERCGGYTVAPGPMPAEPCTTVTEVIGCI
jgi:hypothetical protein